MAMYFFADLRCACLPWLADPPVALWLKLRAEQRPALAWLLTPLTYARVFAKVARLEDLHAAGQYPDEDMALVYGRWALIYAYATERWSAADLEAARAAYNANPDAHKLAEPPPQPQDVFSDAPAGAGVRYNGSTGKWEGVHGQEAIQ